MNLRSKHLVRWGGGAIVVALLVWAFLPKPTPVDLAQVARGPLTVRVEEEGETRVRERYLVSAPVAGRVLRIELEPGDAVVGGDTVLATFQPTLLDARALAEAEARVQVATEALAEARSQRDRARSEATYAREERNRIERLAADGIASSNALDSAALAADTKGEAARTAEIAVRRAAQELEVARAVLTGSDPGVAAEPITLRSPVDGIVLRRLRESESVVPAGDPLVEIGDPAELEIVSDLLSTDAVKVRPGQRVVIERWGGDHELAGRVRRVEPSGFTKVSALGVEEQRVNVLIDFDDPRTAWEALGDGFRVEVAIAIWEADDVVLVPLGALFREDGVWAVFVERDGEVALRLLELGRLGDRFAQVVSGLEAGETVVVHPSDAVVDGARVAPR